MKIFIIFIFLLTLNCSINKVSKTHGFRLLETKYDKFLLNKSNKNDIRKIIGPPSSKSKFDDSWIYIERQKTNQSLMKLGNKKIKKNTIIILEFNNMGLLTNKHLLNLNDMNDLKIAEAKTIKKYDQGDFVYNILSTLREKVNAPTSRQKK